MFVPSFSSSTLKEYCHFIILKISLSESISNIHCSYFGLIDTGWLYSAKLAVPLVVLRCWSKGLTSATGWSTITLGHLACTHNVFFTIVLALIIGNTILPGHLLLHCNRKLPIGPSTLSVSALLLKTWSYGGTRLPLLGWGMSRLCHSLILPS